MAKQLVEKSIYYFNSQCEKNFFLFLKIILYVSLLFLLNVPVHSGKGDYGGIWTETLNFEHQGIRTGHKGTLFHLDGTTPFDIDEYHRKILKDRVDKTMKVTGRDPNVVVASLTLVMQFGDHFEACAQLLAEKKDFLAFVSGSVPGNFSDQKEFEIIQASDGYNPLSLLQEFEERFRAASQPSETGAAAAASAVATVVPSRTVSPFLLEVQQQCVQWRGKQQSQVVKATSSLQALLAGGADSVYTLSTQVQSVFRETERTANSGFGSSVDSEQYLLAHLNKKRESHLSSPKRNIVYQFEKLLEKYKAEKLRQLRKALSTKLQTENTDEMRLVMERFKKELVDYDQVRVQGYIFHLHSTREVCFCCSSSIAEELFCGSLAEELRDEDSPPPFIFGMVSASQRLEEHNRERHGIGPDNRLEVSDYEIVSDIRRAKIQSNMFFQSIIE